MTDYINLISIANGDVRLEANPNPAFQAVYERVVRPQPFNTKGVVTNRPTSGQMWPRGRE